MIFHYKKLVPDRACVLNQLIQVPFENGKCEIIKKECAIIKQGSIFRIDIIHKHSPRVIFIADVLSLFLAVREYGNVVKKMQIVKLALKLIHNRLDRWRQKNMTELWMHPNSEINLGSLTKRRFRNVQLIQFVLVYHFDFCKP